MIYDQPNNQVFSKLEVVQHNNAALVITGAIRGTLKTKFYYELRLESLKSCRWFRSLCYFYKIKRYGLTKYLSKLAAFDIHATLAFQKLLQYIIVELIPSNIVFPVDYC